MKPEDLANGRIDTQARWDAIVIGSGLGGLCSAVILKMAGKKVLVLDRNPVPGGCVQTLSRGGWNWNLGLQYFCPMVVSLGGIKLNESDLLPLITHPPVKLRELAMDTPAAEADGNNVFHRITLCRPDPVTDTTIKRVINIYADKKVMLAYLLKEFPDHAEGIRAFWSYTDIIQDNLNWLPIPKFLPPVLAKFLAPWLHRSFKYLMDTDFDTEFARVFGDSDASRDIRQVFSSYWNMSGLPCTMSLFLWAMSANFEHSKVSIPLGGSINLVGGLIGRIRRAQNPANNKAETVGDVVWGSEYCVTKILTGGLFGNTAVGVTLADGTEIRASRIISAIGLPHTVGGLLPAEKFPRRIRNSLANHVSVTSALSLRIALKPSLSRADLCRFVDGHVTNRTLWDKAWNMDDNPTDPHWPPLEVATLFPMLYATTENDSTTKQTAEVMVLVNYPKFFEKLKDNPEACAQASASMRKILMDIFKEDFSAVAPYVDEENTFLQTPWDMDSQINHANVAMYGLDAYKIYDPDILPSSGIKNLYLSGMDDFVHGITTSSGIIGGVVVLMGDLPFILTSALRIVRALLKMLVCSTWTVLATLVSFVWALPGLIGRMLFPLPKAKRRDIPGSRVLDIMLKTEADRTKA